MEAPAPTAAHARKPVGADWTALKPGRLLLAATSDSMGGMQRVVMSLSRGFAGQGREVDTIVPWSRGGAALAAWAQREGAPVERTRALPDAAAGHSLGDVARLARFIRSRAPAVVNLHYGDVFISLKDVMAVRLSGRRRCVVSVHHPTPWSEAGERKRRLTGLAGRMADAVIVTSGATRKLMLEAGVPPRKLREVPCGVAEPGAYPDRAAARARLGVPQGAFAVSALARLLPHKGIDDLVEACALVPGNDLVLLVGGDGPERERLERLGSERLGDRARFFGRMDDIADLFAASDVFCLPSYLEGFGLVYLEAAMFGVPSIGTRVGGVPEAIVDGETGLLIAPGDIQACAAALDQLRTDPALRECLGQAAYRRAHEGFTDQAMVAGYEQVLFGG